MFNFKKIVSIIMLMVMLATLTPYQAIAAEAPTGSTSEPAAVVEPTQETDTEEAVNEVEAVTEETADTEETTEEEETVTAAPASEGTVVSDAKEESETETVEEETTEEETTAVASTNEIADEVESTDDPADDAATGETSIDVAPAVEPEKKEEKAAVTDLETYITEVQGGTYTVVLQKKDSSGWVNMSRGSDGYYHIKKEDLANTEYRVNVSIVVVNGIANGTYSSDLGIDGLEVTLQDSEGNTVDSLPLEMISTNIGTYSVNGNIVTTVVTDGTNTQDIKINETFSVKFGNCDTNILLDGILQIIIEEETSPALSVDEYYTNSPVHDGYIDWRVRVKTDNENSSAVGYTVVVNVQKATGDYGAHTFDQSKGVKITAYDANGNEVCSWMVRGNNDGLDWLDDPTDGWMYTIPASHGSYTFGKGYDFYLEATTIIDPLPEKYTKYRNNIVLKDEEGTYTRVYGDYTYWNFIDRASKYVSYDDELTNITWTIHARMYGSLLPTDLVAIHDGTQGVSNEMKTVNTSTESFPSNIKVKARKYKDDSSYDPLTDTMTITTEPNAEGYYYTIFKKTVYNNPNGWNLEIHNTNYEDGSGLSIDTEGNLWYIWVIYDTPFSEAFLEYMDGEGYEYCRNHTGVYVNNSLRQSVVADVKLGNKEINIIEQPDYYNDFTISYKIEYMPDKDFALDDSSEMVFKESLSNNQTIYMDSLEVSAYVTQKQSSTSNRDVEKEVDVGEYEVSSITKEETSEGDRKVFTINFKNPERYTYVVTYKCKLDISDDSVIVYDNCNYVSIGSHEEWTESVNDSIWPNLPVRFCEASLLKVDENGGVLKDAEIGLFTADGECLGKKQTGDDGMVTFSTNIAENIIYNMNTPYYLQEINAPAGYVLNDTKKWFVFTDSLRSGTYKPDEYWKGYFTNEQQAVESDYQIINIDSYELTGEYYETEAFKLINETEPQKIDQTPVCTVSAVDAGKAKIFAVTNSYGALTVKSSNAKVATATVSGTNITVKGVAVGTATLTITAAGDKTHNAATITRTVKVTPAATNKLKAAAAANGKGFKLTWSKVPGATGYVIYRNNKKIKTVGNVATYTDARANTNGAKYTYKVYAKAATGTSSQFKSVVTYKVTRPVIKALTNSAAGKMTAKWSKNAKATGYQLQYCTKSTFKGKKTITMPKNTKVSKTISKLTKGKTYYVRLRTYKKVGGKAYFSAWSVTKKVKIKK